MPYTNNTELPTAVKNALPGEAQTIWRKIANSAITQYGDQNKAFATAWAGLRNAGWSKQNGKWAKVEKGAVLDIPIGPDHPLAAYLDIEDDEPEEGGYNTLWVGFWLPPDAGAAMEIPGGEDPEDMHMTLAYMGDLEELPEDAPVTVARAVARFANLHGPLTGKMSGVGIFAGEPEDGADVLYASFDGPDLPKFRQDLVETLEAAGVPPLATHGFTPHVTLAYLDQEIEQPISEILDQLPPVPLTFDWIEVRMGDERRVYLLTGGDRTVSKHLPGKHDQKTKTHGHWAKYGSGKVTPPKHTKAYKKYKEMGHIDESTGKLKEGAPSLYNHKKKAEPKVPKKPAGASQTSGHKQTHAGGAEKPPGTKSGPAAAKPKASDHPPVKMSAGAKGGTTTIQHGDHTELAAKMDGWEHSGDKGKMLAKAAVNMSANSGGKVHLASVTDKNGSPLAAAAYELHPGGNLQIHKIGATGEEKGAGTKLVHEMAKEASKQGAGMETKVYKTDPEAGQFFNKMGFEHKAEKDSSASNHLELDAGKTKALAGAKVETVKNPPKPKPAPAPKLAASKGGEAPAKTEFDISPTTTANMKSNAGHLSKLLDAGNTVESSGQSKARISKELAGRLEGNKHFDDYLKAEINPNFDKLPPEKKKAIREEATSNLVHLWAETSADSNDKAVAMQLAAAKEFKLSGVETSHFGTSTVAGANAHLAKHEDAMRGFLRAQYDNTQQWFKDKGITHVYVARGAGFSDHAAPSGISFTGNAGKGKVALQPLSSFSADMGTANAFTGIYGGGNKRMIVAAKIPVENIIGTAQTGYGCKHEHEVVVLGGVKDVLHFSWNSGGKWSNSDGVWTKLAGASTKGAKAQMAAKSFWSVLKADDETGTAYIPMDDDPQNADWTKGSWDLPEVGSKEFKDMLQFAGMTMEQFKHLPAYQWQNGGEGVEKSWRREVQITKLETDQHLVFGWAGIAYDENGLVVPQQFLRADGQVEDTQHDMIDEPELEQMAYNFVLHYREGGEMHLKGGSAVLVESVVFTNEKQRAMGIPEGTLPVGWWIGFLVTDETAWDLIKKGHYRAFSIEGSAIREEVDDNGN